MLMSHLFQRMYLHIIFQATTSASQIKFCQFILHACSCWGENQQEQQRKAEELERQREVEQQREVELQRELDSLCSYFSILFHHLLHFMQKSMRTIGNH